MKDTIALSVTEDSQVGEARRIALSIATELGFDETERGKVGIVVTEAAKNLVKHATHGELLLQTSLDNGASRLEILALDKGPGMVNISKCLQDGYSTAGTPGNGLGAIARPCNFFEIYSLPDVGTALMAQFRPLEAPRKQEQSVPSFLQIGALSLPKTGEKVCGDAWGATHTLEQSRILVADGLGHGPTAAEASCEAVRIFQENTHRSLTEIIEVAHAALRSTRGAAVAIAEIEPARQILRFVGVGNISGAIFLNGESRSLVSYNGTVGHQVRKFQELVYPWIPGSILTMHSDGLATQWRLDRYAGLIQKHPSTIAGVLYRDFSRGRDDVTVAIAKDIREPLP